jgi:hypothetical protein
MVREILRSARDKGHLIGNTAIEEVDDLRLRKTSVSGLRLVVRRGTHTRRLYVEASNRQHGKSAASTVKRLAEAVDTGQVDCGVLLREDAFPLPPVANSTLAELTPRGVVVWLREREVAPLAALEALLNAAAAHDLPVDRATALDLALAQLDGELGFVEKLVNSVFEKTEEGSTPSQDQEAIAQVHEYLRARCAFEPIAGLSAALHLSIERVHSAVRALTQRGHVEIVEDRNRAQVVMLRPEGFE